MKAVDVHGFAGAFALGVARAGFEIVAKREDKSAFGVSMWQDNARLLKFKGDDIQTEPAGAWNPVKADLVFGNPPCSAFSMRATNIRMRLPDGTLGWADFRGSDNAINQCMHDLVQYAGSCDPKIVIFESVQGARSKGAGLMRVLREELEQESGKKYRLTHVLHSCLGNGGAQERKRYFWVAHRVPFGVEPHPLHMVTTVRDRIGDLELLEAGEKEGHVWLSNPRAERMRILDEAIGWRQGEKSGEAYRRAMAQGVEVPWETWSTVETTTAQYCPKRLTYDEPAFVMSGKSLTESYHPVNRRFISHREVARLMGFPDSWKARAAVAMGSNGQLIWGKGIPVESGAWVAKWAMRSLQRKPGSITGEEVGEREYEINLTHHWKQQLGLVGTRRAAG